MFNSLDEQLSKSAAEKIRISTSVFESYVNDVISKKMYILKQTARLINRYHTI